MRFRFGKSLKKNNGSDREGAVFDLLDRLRSFFSTEPQKEKVLREEDFNRAGDVYYASISAAYKIAERILLTVSVVFLLVSIATNYKEITFDNFYYLVKDFSSAVDAETVNKNMLSYDSDPRNTFSVYRGGLAVANPSKLTVYTATGRKTLNESLGMSSPGIVTSDKYVLVYDSAGKEFALYNSFSQIYDEVLDHPITDACIGDDGSFAVVTRSSDNRALIHYYSKKFTRLFTVKANRYCFDVKIDTERDLLAASFYDIGDGMGYTTIDFWSISDHEMIDRIELEAEFPLSTAFLEDGNFGVLTDRAVRIYDDALDVEESVECSYSVITGYFTENSGIAISYVKESKNMIIAFDKSGDLLYNGVVYRDLNDVGVVGEYVYARSDEGVLRIKGEEIEIVDSGDGKMLVYDENTVLVCNISKSRFVEFND